MTITLSSEDPRTVKAISIWAYSSRWYRGYDRSGRPLASIPSQRRPDVRYLVTLEWCECEDFRRHGLSRARLGQSGEHIPCKHIRALQMDRELGQALLHAQQQARRAPRRRGHLRALPPSETAEDTFRRFEGD